MIRNEESKLNKIEIKPTTENVIEMLDKNAIHIVEEAERLGLGTTLYELVSID